MIAIAILLAGAAAGFGVAKWFRLPTIPLLMAAGLALASLGVLEWDQVLENTLVLGITFLVFLTGIELNPARVGPQKGAALRVGIAQFAALGVGGYAVARLLGFPLVTSMYLAVALTASSTLVVVRILQQRGQLFEPFGRLVIGVLLLQDLVVFLLIPVLSKMPEGPGPVALGLAGFLALVGLAYACVRWVSPFLVNRMRPDEESLLLSVLALLFVFIGLASVLDLPLVAGAFLAGVSLSGFPVRGMVRAQLNSLGDFFLAIFFTALGALVVVPSGVEILRALALVAVVLLLTPPMVTAVAERYGLSARASLESGLLLSQTSELSLIVGLQGLVNGQISSEVFTTIALVTVITMVLTPFVATDRMTWRLMRWHPTRRRRPRRAETPSGHVLLLGCGDNGMPLLETLLSSGREVVVIDDDPAVVARLREGDVHCIRGDASDFAALDQAGVREARVIVSTIRRATDSASLLRYTGEVPVLARVFSEEEAEQVRAAGGTPVLYSRAAAEDFMRWLEQAETVGIRHERRKRPRD